MDNWLTLAVAGGRKTQGIVEHCEKAPPERRILLLTFTTFNQRELKRRVSRYAGNRHNVEVMGWYSFLLRHFAKPFLPFKFAGKRVLGFNFDGRPHRFAQGLSRFLDSGGAAYGCELGRLSYELIADSGGALVRRLECMYEEILIDEVQDLSGYDWEIVHTLLKSSIQLRLVGDIRQSVLATNPRGSKNKQYAYANSLEWARKRSAEGLLKIVESTTTWRCHPEIAKFADSIFDQSWGFPETISVNTVTTGHDGVFVLGPKDVDEYVKQFRPQCLRHSASSGNQFSVDFLNFKVAKGMTYERVLIVPTANIAKFVANGSALEIAAASSFYVAVTRASQSVAIVIDKAGKSELPCWRPPNRGVY